MKNLLPSLIYIFIFFATQAQQPPQRIQFEHLTVADGLPENSVACMIQDHLGYMWLGTQNGLVRYDGTKMTSFRYDPANVYTLKGLQIRTLYEDRKGDVWIGANGNLFRFERATQRFIEYPRKPPERIEDTDWIPFIYEDKQGDFWVITRRSSSNEYVLDRLNPITNTWTYFRNNPKNINSLAKNSIYLSSTNSINNFAFLEANDGKIWVTTRTLKENVLHWFDRKREQFIRFKPNTTPQIAEDFKKITTIATNKNGQLYLSSFANGKGMFVLNPTNGQIKQYKHDPNNSNSPRNDSLTKVYQDYRGLLWVPTNQGLDRLDQKTGIFTHYVSKPNDPTSPSKGLLKFLHEMPNGDMWFVTKDGKGLNFYDRKHNQFVRYENDDKNENGLIDGGFIQSFLIDKTGLVWAGTFVKGVNKQSRLTKFPLLKSIPKNPNSLQNSTVYCIYEAPSEPAVIWFGTKTGLDRLDKKTGNYTHYRNDSLNTYSLGKGFVSAIKEDKKGRFWVATWDSGFNLLDRITGKFTHFKHNPADANSLMTNNINSFLPTTDSTFWIGTNYGLDRFDINQKKFTHYYKTDSSYAPALFNKVSSLAIPNNQVAAILHPKDKLDKTSLFSLNQVTNLLVIAGGNLVTTDKYDYGWIEDGAGKIVWEMSYENSKGDGLYGQVRIQINTIKLAAGNYKLRYQTNGDYSYNNWSFAPPPLHPDLWGIQLLQIAKNESQNLNQLIHQKYQREGLSDNVIFTLYEDTKKQLWNGSNNGGVNYFNPLTGKLKTYYDRNNGPLCVIALLDDAKTGGFWVGDYVFGLLKLT